MQGKGWAQERSQRPCSVSSFHSLMFLCFMCTPPITTNDLERLPRTLDLIIKTVWSQWTILIQRITGSDMHCGKVDLPVQIMVWREVNWSGIYWCDSGKKWWEPEPKWGSWGWSGKYKGVEWTGQGTQRKTKMISKRWWLSRCKRRNTKSADEDDDLSLNVYGTPREEDHSLIYPFNTLIKHMLYAKLWQGVGE